MANDTRSRSKLKDEGDKNSGVRQTRGLSTSGTTSSDKSGLRRSARETSSKEKEKEKVFPSPSGIRKSERLEKLTPTPPGMGKSERVENKCTPSPLRRSDRGKKHSLSVSTSSESKGSDKGLSSSSKTQKHGQNEKTVKQLTQEATELSLRENQGAETVYQKPKTMSARAYRALFKKQPQRVEVAGHYSFYCSSWFPLLNFLIPFTLWATCSVLVSISRHTLEFGIIILLFFLLFYSIIANVITILVAIDIFFALFYL